MIGADWAKYQPNNDSVRGLDFVILQTSFATTEEPGWRDKYNFVRSQGKQVGFYHFYTSTNVVAETEFFASLVLGSWDTNPPPYMGYWGDFEQSFMDSTYIDEARQTFKSPMGVYGPLGMFHSNYPEYQHYPINWVASPDETPNVDWVMWQYGQANGMDMNRTQGRIQFPSFIK